MGAFVAAPLASAGEEVVRWVDDAGVVHFGHPQFAPPGAAQPVHIDPANGMDAPAVPVRNETRTTGGPNFTTIARSPKKNPRGWRGYQPATQRNEIGRRR